jgi:hypothetical protein
VKIWALPLLLIASGPAFAIQAETVPDEEIVVTAKVNRIKITLGRDAQGKVACQLNQSSGDVTIDSAVCREAAKCVGKKPVPQAKMEACIDKRKNALVKRWTRANGGVS